MPPTESPADPAPEPRPDAEASSTPAAPAALPDDDGVPEGLAGDPSLRGYLLDRWRAAPWWGRVALVAAVVAFVGWVAVPTAIQAAQGPSEEELQARAALERAQWAAMLRQSPVALTTTSVAARLEPGDAERSDDRYADYYAYEADSTAFSILITSDDFAPDLAVRRPDGVTVAASSLLRTRTRAEIDGLHGPGRFEVVVTSRDPRAGGAYELAVLPAAPLDSVTVDGEAMLDTLGAGPLRAGRHEHAYGIGAGSDLPVVVRVVSGAFTPRVHLLGPNGEITDATERVAGDSLRGVVVRFLPGWDSAYRLLVTSEERGGTGPFALDVRSVPIRELALGERATRGTLGDESWTVDGRLLDTYRFRLRDASRVTIAVQSEAFAPAFRLWRIDGRKRDDVAGDPNPREGGTVRHEAELAAGEYFLEVTSGGEDATLAGGDYSVIVEAESTAPPPDSTGGKTNTATGSRYFPTEVRRTGESGGSTFEVGVTGVAIAYPAGRTRVQLAVTVRSIDYTGNWAPWDSFARKAYVVDDRGRRYNPSVAESVSPSGAAAEPGTARRGIVVFYLPESTSDFSRLVLVASIGERTLTLPIQVP